MVGACARRVQVVYAHARGISFRRACGLLSVARSARRYQSRLAVKDAPILTHMRELSMEYPRFGYRRIQVFLDRLGHPMSADRVHRLWRCAGLQVPRKRPRRRIAACRPRPLAPSGMGQMWAYDFVFDACDNGSEFLSRAILRWLAHEKIETALIDPGKPWQNGTNESFNGKFRDECLSMEWFRNRVDAKIVIENWRRHYNEVRPHSSLQNLTPIQFKQQLSQPRPKGAIS